MTSPFSLEGKTALVTGGNQGLGKAFALGLAEAGARVAISGRRDEANQAAAEEARAAGFEFATITADITDDAQVATMTEQALAGLGVVQAMGLRSPDDVSVAGFDGTDIARYVFPTLTTVVSDPVAWGGAAAGTLLHLVADGHADDVDLAAAELRIAESTAPPPDAEPTPTNHLSTSISPI